VLLRVVYIVFITLIIPNVTNSLRLLDAVTELPLFTQALPLPLKALLNVGVLLTLLKAVFIVLYNYIPS